jgi:hypothetical protein
VRYWGSVTQREERCVFPVNTPRIPQDIRPLWSGVSVLAGETTNWIHNRTRGERERGQSRRGMVQMDIKRGVMRQGKGRKMETSIRGIQVE